MSTVGERVRKMRLSAGLSQQDLERLSGCAQRTISELENDVRQPFPSTIRKLARALDTTPAVLMYGPDEVLRAPKGRARAAAEAAEFLRERCGERAMILLRKRDLNGIIEDAVRFADINVLVTLAEQFKCMLEVIESVSATPPLGEKGEVEATVRFELRGRYRRTLRGRLEMLRMGIERVHKRHKALLDEAQGILDGAADLVTHK